MNVTNSWQAENRIRAIIPWTVLLLILLVSLWLRWQYIRIPSFHYDEGHWLMFAILANAGYPAYSVTFVGIPPLTLLLIQLGVKLFGTSLLLRYPMMLVSLAGVGSIFWLFRPTIDRFGLMAGALAAMFLSFAPLYFRESVSIMAEVPAVAMALLSLVLAQQFYLSKRPLWLGLSGITFGLSFTIKVFVIFLPILIGILILLAVVVRDKSKLDMLRQLVGYGLVWVFGVIIPIVAFAIVYEPVAMYQQVIAFRFALREVTLARGITPSENVESVIEMLVEYRLQLIAAILGVIVGWCKRWLDISVWVIWFVLAMLLLIWHVPLRGRYLVLLLPAFAALNSILIAWLVMWLVDWDRRRGKWFGRVAVALLLATVAGWTVAMPVRSVLASSLLPPSSNMFGNPGESVRDAIAFVKNNTTPDECVVTDDQRLAISAERLVPPALSETSSARLRTGWLINIDTILDEVDQHNCPMLVYMSQIRFNKFLPDLPAQLRKLYLLEIKYDEKRTIYAVRKNVTRQPGVPLDVKTGDNIELRGIDLTPAPWYPGQQVQLAAYWTALTSPPQAYKISVRLRNDQNEAVANFDHFPFPAPSSKYRLILTTNDLYQIKPNVDNLENISEDDLAVYPGKGMIPTNGWPVGNTIREVTTMNLPTDLPLGTYHLFIGLYDPDTLERLPVRGEMGEPNEFLLATVEIIELN